MELRYYINSTQISEPIGFDDFKTILKRTKQHGVSAETSIGELEFDGVAFGIIKTAYNTDIDTSLVFKAEIKCVNTDTWTTLYSGLIDLSTYMEQSGDYCSCKVSVGEIGVKTTFNNRVDTVVDVARLTSMDGDILNAYSNIGKSIDVPIVYIEKKIHSTQTLLSIYDDVNISASNPFNIAIPFYVPEYIELSKYNEHSGFNKTPETIDALKQFTNLESYIQNNSFHILCNLRFSALIESAITFTSFYVELKLESSAIPIYTSNLDYPIENIEKNYSIDIDINKVINPNDVLTINIRASISDVSQKTIKLKTDVENSLLIECVEAAFDTPSEVKVSMIHETLSRLSEIYSGITVRSDYYGRVDSDVNPLLTGVGKGALKACFTGLQLRRSYYSDGSLPRLETSFKDIFNSLNAIDNIGWGFVKDGNADYLQVENWKYFYNSNSLLTINSPSNKKRTMRDDLITRLEIGYNKYAGEDDINLIYILNSTREFTSGIKAIDNKNEQQSKFISDQYSIEFTRRNAFEDVNKNAKNDKDIFILALKRNKETGVLSVEQGVTGYNVNYPESTLNARISPMRNALRWADKLFEINSPISYYTFTAGVGNTMLGCVPLTSNDYDYLDDSGDGNILIEGSVINAVTPYLKPELIEFEYPLTLAEYNDIANDPYGIITVDGEDCYLQEIIRQPLTGMCEFKLIPKI